MIVRVSVGLLGYGRTFFIIGGEGLFVPAATVGFAMGIHRICADRDCIANTADDGEGKQNLVVPSPI